MITKSSRMKIDGFVGNRRNTSETVGIRRKRSECTEIPINGEFRRIFIFSSSRLLRKGISRGCEECDCFLVKQSLQKDIKLVTLNGTRRLQRRSLRLPTRSKSAQTGHLCTTTQAGADPGIFVCRSKFPGFKVGRRSWLANMALQSSTWNKKSNTQFFSLCRRRLWHKKKHHRYSSGYSTNNAINTHYNTFTINKACWH